MVAQEGQPVAEDQDAHHVVANLEVLLVAELRQIGCCDALELAAVGLLLGHVEASRLDQYVHEDHVLVVPRDHVDGVGAVHPSLFQDVVALAFQERGYCLVGVVLDYCFHDDDLLVVSTSPFGLPCGCGGARVQSARKGDAKPALGRSNPVVFFQAQCFVFGGAGMIRPTGKKKRKALQPLLAKAGSVRQYASQGR